MKKIFYSDVDDTLVDPQVGYTKTIDQITEIVQKNQDYFVPCSGRPTLNLMKKFKKYNVEYLIGFNGGEIKRSTGEIIYQNTLSIADVKLITTELSSLKIDYLLYKDDIYTNNIYNEYGILEADLNEMKLKEISDLFPSIKILGLSDPQKTEVAIKILREKLNSYEIISSKPFFIEITPKGVSKGEAIKKLNQKLKLNNKQTYCFGDSNNDLSMFALDIIKVAVKNANKSIKSRATFITDTCQNNGVEKFIKNLYGENNEKN